MYIHNLHSTFYLISSMWFRTGSRVICDPVPEGSDDDYMLFGNRAYIHDNLLKIGFKMTSEDYGDGSWFNAYRMDEYNVLVTDSLVFFERFEAATALAKARNILDKEQRVAMFQRILYGDGGHYPQKPFQFPKKPPEPVKTEELI